MLEPTVRGKGVGIFDVSYGKVERYYVHGVTNSGINENQTCGFSLIVFIKSLHTDVYRDSN